MTQLNSCPSAFSRLGQRRSSTGIGKLSILGGVLGGVLSAIALVPGSAIAQSQTAQPAIAQSAAPTQLTDALKQIDTAANNRNAAGVIQFYSPNFSHSDGLTRTSLEKALTQFWQRYPTVSYRTELQSWKSEGSALLAETTTYITGTQKEGDREYKINSTLRSRQRFENQKIVRQEILSEQTKITSGSNPPNVKLSLPEQVNPGQEFSLDAIVQEPLGDSLLLGAALEEPVKADGFLNPTRVDLELLSSGGIFKVGRAPKTPDNRWISAVLVRQDGMTMITQRLRILDRRKK